MIDKIFGSARPRKPEDDDEEEVVLLDWDDLRKKKQIKYHRSYLRKMWEADPPRFPPPRHLSPRKLVWTEKQIDRWRAAKIKAGE